MNQKKILVVDDEPEISDFLEKVLSKYGYSVTTLTDPIKALEEIKNKSYNLLITDIRMPGMTGLELIEKTHSLNLAQPLEVVVISAHATVDTAIECMRKGAIDYLVKPFEIKEILATVEKALATQELKSRLVSMEEMDKLKDEFISTVTHELKTPLMAIQGAAELLGMRDANTKFGDKEGKTEESTAANPPAIRCEEEIKKFSDIVLRQTNKMKHLIDDLLDSARIDAHRLVLNKVSVEFNTLVNEAISEVRPLADSKCISINYKSCYAGDLIIRCDPRQIKRALNNILVNAIKYTAAGGHVNIEIPLRKNSSELMVTVQDTGIGLKEENLDKIFEKFYRVETVPSEGVAGGFGLGLSIAKKIIELHSGKIWAESEGPGKGARFIFILPVESE